MNWGHKIAIAYGLFVVLMVGLVIACIQQKDMFLVSNDYYAQELAFEEVIQKKANVAKLGQPIAIAFDGTNKKVQLDLSEASSGATGKITFYRPSNSNYDITLPLNLASDGTQSVDTEKLPKGLWVVKVDWKKGDTGYYTEQKVEVQ